MAKWDKLRKKERNKALIKYANKHPQATLAEIGEIFNISLQRVWQILHSNKVKA